MVKEEVPKLLEVVGAPWQVDLVQDQNKAETVEGGVKRCTRSCCAKPCIDVVAGFCIAYYSLMVLPANVGCLSLCERIKIAEIICQKVKVGRAFSAKGELSLWV